MDVAFDLPEDPRLASDMAAMSDNDGLLDGAYIALKPGGLPDYLARDDEFEDDQGAVSLISLMMKVPNPKVNERME